MGAAQPRGHPALASPWVGTPQPHSGCPSVPAGPFISPMSPRVPPDPPLAPTRSHGTHDPSWPPCPHASPGSPDPPPHKCPLLSSCPADPPCSPPWGDHWDARGLRTPGCPPWVVLGGSSALFRALGASPGPPRTRGARGRPWPAHPARGLRYFGASDRKGNIRGPERAGGAGPGGHRGTPRQVRGGGRRGHPGVPGLGAECGWGAWGQQGGGNTAVCAHSQCPQCPFPVPPAHTWKGFGAGSASPQPRGAAVPPATLRGWGGGGTLPGAPHWAGGVPWPWGPGWGQGHLQPCNLCRAETPQTHLRRMRPPPKLVSWGG